MYMPVCGIFVATKNTIGLSKTFDSSIPLTNSSRNINLDFGDFGEFGL